jgi:hypothetical protein
MLDFEQIRWDNKPMENLPEPAPPAEMKYWRAYLYFFDSPKWTMNLLLGALCTLIPVLGGIVFMGYGYEAVEEMHRKGKDDQYPEFDFNRFVKYLVRGCWPFIWQLIIGFPVGFIMGFCYSFAEVAVVGTGDQQGSKPGVLIPILIIVVVVGMVLSLIMSVLLVPILLRSA